MAVVFMHQKQHETTAHVAVFQGHFGGFLLG
jgi:hypothetical protein